MAADCSDKIHAIYVTKSSPIHSTITLPTQYLNLGEAFSNSAYVNFNWGSEVFYRAGNDIWQFVKAGREALLTDSPGVVYIEPSEMNPESAGRMFSMVKVMATDDELRVLSKRLSDLIARDSDGKNKILSLAENFGPGYTRGAIFYRSSIPYKGIRFTCNNVVSRVMSHTVSSFGKFDSTFVNPIFKYLKQRSQRSESCVQWVGRDLE